MGNKKILTAVIVFLMIVVIIQSIIYYLLQQRNSLPYLSISFDQTKTSIDKNITRIINNLQGMPVEKVDFLANVISIVAKKDSTYQSSILTNTVSGIISKLEHKKGQLSAIYPYEESLTLTIQGRKEPLRVIYSKIETENITIQKESNATKLTFSDLKEGDMVTITEQFNIKNFAPTQSSIVIRK